MLELPDQEFKTTVFNMLRAQMDKVDRMKNRWTMEAQRWKF